MTHEIEVKVKVENVAGEIVFFVSDIESSVRKNLANFDNWLYAKWIENGVFHCIESEAFQSVFSQQNEMLAQDTIRIALNIAGYDIENMNQFERASAILDVATEYKARGTL